MDRISFQNKVREMTEKNPKLFALKSDAKVDMEMQIDFYEALLKFGLKCMEI